jgi:hypothetical protein
MMGFEMEMDDHEIAFLTIPNCATGPAGVLIPGYRGESPIQKPLRKWILARGSQFW